MTSLSVFATPRGRRVRAGNSIVNIGTVRTTVFQAGPHGFRARAAHGAITIPTSNPVVKIFQAAPGSSHRIHAQTAAGEMRFGSVFTANPRGRRMRAGSNVSVSPTPDYSGRMWTQDQSGGWNIPVQFMAWSATKSAWVPIAIKYWDPVSSTWKNLPTPTGQ